MFNKKLKQRIKELENSVWQLQNPPKHKVGDKSKDKTKTIVSIEFKAGDTVYPEYFTRVNVVYYLNRWEYTIFNSKTKELYKTYQQL